MSELYLQFQDCVLDQTQSLFLDDRALVVESIEDKIDEFFDDVEVGRAKELTDLFELVDGDNLVLVGGGSADHVGVPI